MNKYRQHITLTAILFGVLALGVSLFSFSSNIKHTLQLTGQGEQLLDSSWDYLPGAKFQNNSLTISNQDWAVRTLENTYLPNPPALLYSKHLEGQGDVSIEAALSQRSGTAAFTLFSKPPFVMDEQLFAYPYLEVSLSDSQATVNAWVQNTEQPAFTKSVNHTGQSASFTITRSNGDVSVRFSNGQAIAVTLNNVLSGNTIWFGASSKTSGGSWQLDSIIGKSLGGPAVSVVNSQDVAFKKTQDGLQTVASSARGDFKVGAAVSLMPAVTDPNYGQSAFGGDFGQITTENALKMQFVQPQRGSYEFAESDALVALVKKHGMTVHGHALVFGEANPAWLNSVPKNEVESVMLDHIQTVVGHFKDSIYSWDVINEPLADYDAFTAASPLRKHVWQQAVGSSYIEKALRAAHAANPNAELWINDFGMEGSVGDGGDSERFDAMLALASDLKAKGVPLTGIGFQSHVYEKGDEIIAQTFESRLSQLEKLGLKARVSELDVHNDAGRTAQATQFATVAKACFTHKNCTSLTTWGVNDAYGSTGSVESTEFYPGDGLLWDVRNSKVAGYESVKQALRDAGAAANSIVPTPFPTTITAASPTPTPTSTPAPVATPLPTTAPQPTQSPSPTPVSTQKLDSKTLRVVDNRSSQSLSVSTETSIASTTPTNQPETTEKNIEDTNKQESRRRYSYRSDWFRRFLRWFGFKVN